MTISEPRYWFFSGKGGVGKTSLSAATAVHLAASGKRTLILTTDPASNLADVFEQPIGHRITPIAAQENLFAMELDPDRATEEYKERSLAPLRGVLPESMVKVMEEQLDSPCTSEMATFERFVGFLRDDDFDIIVFDTAPTGHTLRLLELPADWSRVIESGANTCIGPAQALADSKAAFDRAFEVLKDPQTTKFVFILRPERSSLEETKRSVTELAGLDIETVDLITNGILPPEARDSAFFRAKYRTQIDCIRNIVAFAPNTKALWLRRDEIRGVESLREVSRLLYEDPMSAATLIEDSRAFNLNGQDIRPEPLPLGSRPVIKLGASESGGTQLVFFTGKGGVGKTVLSCTAAVALADHDRRTLLVTTDPAAHLAHVLDEAVDNVARPVASVDNLWAARIDPRAEAQAYKARVLADAKDRYSAKQLLGMEEELNSPCTEEMAVFYRFIELVSRDDFDYIVFDTAPTGHTLRLLRLPVEWNKQLEIKTFTGKKLSEADAGAKAEFETVINRLQDRNRTSFIFVVLPEHTPIIEAHRAAQDLEAVGIKPAAVIANQVVEPAQATGPFFVERLKTQERHLQVITRLFGMAPASMPLLPEEPRGVTQLRAAPISFRPAKAPTTQAN